MAEAIRLLSGLELAVVPWDFRQVEVSGRFAALAWTHGLSLGDRACLTLAARLDVPAVTTDRAWARLRKTGVTIKLVR